jgi:hypothetical protein
VYNQFPFNIVPEICIVTMNGGVFATQQGTSSIFTGILTKEAVLKTKEENPTPHIDSESLKREVGGSISNLVCSAVGKPTKKLLEKPPSGGVSSGGVSSGGSHPHSSKLKKFVK